MWVGRTPELFELESSLATSLPPSPHLALEEARREVDGVAAGDDGVEVAGV